MKLRQYSVLIAQLSAMYLVVLGLYVFPLLKRMYIHAQVQAATPVAEAKDNQEQSPKIEGNPIRVSVPSVNISVAVLPGEYSAKAWTLTKDKAHFAKMTEQPNTESGNTLIYGHNVEKVFRKTAKIQEGDELFVETENGYRFIYRFVSSKNVSPKDTSIFEYEGAPQVTLLTCDGWFSSERKLLFFEFVKVVHNE